VIYKQLSQNYEH